MQRKKIERSLDEIRRKRQERLDAMCEDGGPGSGIKGHKTYHYQPPPTMRGTSVNTPTLSRKGKVSMPSVTKPSIPGASGKSQIRSKTGAAASKARQATGAATTAAAAAAGTMTAKRRPSAGGTRQSAGQVSGQTLSNSSARPAPKPQAVAKNTKRSMGNIDLANRPQVSAQKMRDAGYNVPAGSVSTTHSSYKFIKQNGKYVCVHFSPIMQDGTVLTPDEMNTYLSSMGGDILGGDKDGKNLVLNVEELPGLISEKDMEDYMTTGKTTPALEEYMKKAQKWDDDLNNAQADLYKGATGPASEIGKTAASGNSSAVGAASGNSSAAGTSSGNSSTGGAASGNSSAGGTSSSSSSSTGGTAKKESQATASTAASQATKSSAKAAQKTQSAAVKKPEQSAAVSMQKSTAQTARSLGSLVAQKQATKASAQKEAAKAVGQKAAVKKTKQSKKVVSGKDKSTKAGRKLATSKKMPPYKILRGRKF